MTFWKYEDEQKKTDGLTREKRPTALSIHNARVEAVFQHKTHKDDKNWEDEQKSRLKSYQMIQLCGSTFHMLSLQSFLLTMAFILQKYSRYLYTLSRRDSVDMN